MVMADRPDVETASLPVAAIDTVGLAATMTLALCRVPFRAPWRGSGSVPHNVAVTVTREVIRSFLGYSMSLPVKEFRSIEKLLDGVSGAVLPPWIDGEHVSIDREVVGGVPGLWFRHRGEIVSTIVHLHGGGYIGTSPNMYALFAAHMARSTRSEIFVADYRLAPEFPYPAARDDACAVLDGLAARGIDPARTFLSGDSGGGGLAATVLYERGRRPLPALAGVLLFSPEVSLLLDRPSVRENAATDVLPWNIPTNAYLHGLEPDDVAVSAGDVSAWPPVFVAFGDDEMFRDAIRDLVDRLGEAGIPTETHELADMFHVFPMLMPWAAESRTVYAAAGEWVGYRLDGQGCEGLGGSPSNSVPVSSA
jgi:epsilon-lactone hydrolase